jgi:hypothetical protein
MTMADVMLNGRVPTEWELPVIEHARRCERERDAEQLAGLLTDGVRREPDRPPRPVTDLLLEFS